MKIKLIALLMLIVVVGTSQNINYLKDSLIVSDLYNKMLFESLNAKQQKSMIKDSLVLCTSMTKSEDRLYYINEKGEPCSQKATYLYYVEGSCFNGKKNGVHKYYCPDVKNPKDITLVLVKEMTFKNDTLNGPYKYFFPDGRLANEGNYFKDEKEGKDYEYYPDGKLLNQCLFINGVIDGAIIEYYHDGKVKYILNTRLHKPHGLYIKYYPDGKEKEEWNYIDGKANGRYRYYHENGVVWVEREYKKSLLWNIISKSDSQGNPLDKGTLKDGNGTEKSYNEFNELYMIETYKNGVLLDTKEVKTIH